MRWLAAVLTVVILAVGGFFGWKAWEVRQEAAAVAEVRTLVAEGHLKDAKARAEALRAEHPDSLDAYVVSALALRALHDRPGGQEVLDAAYERSPAGFPLLPELVDHRLRGPDDPRKGWKLLEFLDGHLAAHPEDTNLVAEGRLVALAYLLGQKNLPGDQLPRVRELTETALSSFTIEGQGTTTQHYDRAQALLALGRKEESVATGRAGIAAGTDVWEGLVMGWAIAVLAVHEAPEEQAWAEIEAVRSRIASWEGTHFGMGKPLLEFMKLTAAIRYDREVETPPGYEGRQARLDAEGVRLQVGDEETRGRVIQLLEARKRRDADGVLRAAEDVLSIVARDRGCEMENQIIRPNTRAMLLAARGEALGWKGDLEGAATAWEEAAGLFPQDAWMRGKAEAARAVASEDTATSP